MTLFNLDSLVKVLLAKSVSPQLVIVCELIFIHLFRVIKEHHPDKFHNPDQYFDKIMALSNLNNVVKVLRAKSVSVQLVIVG